MIQKIIAKAKRGEPLSQDEERILVEDSVRGILLAFHAVNSMAKRLR